MQTSIIVYVLAGLLGLIVQASPGAFRLSFLDEKPVLADTCQLLKQKGFLEESVASFKKLVEHHILSVLILAIA